MLAIAGALGLVWALVMVPEALWWGSIAVGYQSPIIKGLFGWSSRLPTLLQGALGQYAMGLIPSLVTVAVSSALLFVRGGRSGTATSIVGFIWIVGAMLAIDPGGRILRWVSRTGSITPLALIGVVSIVVVTLVSVVSFLTAYRLFRADQVTPASEPPA